MDVDAGALLRDARRAAGLTQARLAERAGVTQSVISAYESGRREPALSTLSRLVSATGSRLAVDVVAPEERAADGLPREGLGARLRRLRVQVLQVLDAHGASNVQVFGSAARGDDRSSSDIDLLVDLPAGTSLLAIGRLTEDLEKLLDAKVDVIPRDAVKPAVRTRIERDLVTL